MRKVKQASRADARTLETIGGAIGDIMPKRLAQPRDRIPPREPKHASDDIATVLMNHSNSPPRRFVGDTLPVGKHPWWIFFGLILAGILMLPVDVPLAAFCAGGGLPGELRRLLQRTEFFGHAYGVLGIAGTVYLVDLAQRRKIGRLLACSLGAGLIVDIMKGLVHRTRPHDFDFELGVAETFRGLSFLHADNLGEMISSGNHSLPSAHTAVAMGLAIALGWMYPHARRWFVVLACLVGMGRVDGSAHFASDVFWGAAVGYLSSYACFVQPTLARRLARWESGDSQPTRVLAFPLDERYRRAG